MSIQTKEAIVETFLALARQKNIDKITVKELADCCGISRQSFYYHFQDILAVIEWLLQRAQQDISARCRAASSPDEAVRIMVGLFIEHYPLYKKLRDSQKRDFVERLALDSMQSHFRLAVSELGSDHRVTLSVAEAQALIRFYSFGLAGLMFHHCASGNPNADELTRQILIILQRTPLQPPPPQSNC